MEADVVAVLQLHHDVEVVERLAPREDDPLEDRAGVVRRADVAPDLHVEPDQDLARVPLVALEGIVHLVHARTSARRRRRGRDGRPTVGGRDAAEKARHQAREGEARGRGRRRPSGRPSRWPRRTRPGCPRARPAAPAPRARSARRSGTGRDGAAAIARTIGSHACFRTGVATKARRSSAQRSSGIRVDRDARAPQPLQLLAEEERDVADGGARLLREAVDEGGAAAADQEVRRRGGDADVGVARLAVPRPLRELRGEAVDPLARDARRRAVGVGVHPVGAGEDPLEVGRAVDERLPRLVRDPLHRVDVAEADLLAGRDGVLLRAPDDDDRVVRAAAEAPAEALELGARPARVGPRLGVEEVRELVEAGDDADAPRQLVREDVLGLRRPGERPGEPREARRADAERPLPELEAGAHLLRLDPALPRLRAQVRDLGGREELRHVLRLDAERGGGREAAAVELVPELQEVHLPPRLAVDEARRPARLRDSLDLDAPAAADRDVHVLARGAEAGADVPRRAADAADEEDRLLDLVGGPAGRAP